MANRMRFEVLGSAEELSKTLLPLISSSVRAGFPSPADDYVESQLDLVEHLVAHPSATYYVRAKGDSMTQLGIESGDLLVVDRSLEPKHGDIIIIAVDGDLTCKSLQYRNNKPYLVAGNPNYPTISLEGIESHVWGVVIHTIHSFRKKRN